MATKTWVNMTHEPDPTIAATDHAITVGDAVFETIGVYNHKPHNLEAHIQRLHTSAAKLAIEIPYTTQQLETHIRQICEQHPNPGLCRLTVTAGPGPQGSARTPNSTGTTITTLTEYATPTTFAHIITGPWKRNPHSILAGAKTTSYGENAAMLAYARNHGADEIIIANTYDYICEGTGTNIIYEHNNKLYTPTTKTGCLKGTARDTALTLAAEHGIEIITEDHKYHALATTQQAALTSSLRGIQPISHIDGRELEETSLVEQLQTLWNEHIKTVC